MLPALATAYSPDGTRRYTLTPSPNPDTYAWESTTLKVIDTATSAVAATIAISGVNFTLLPAPTDGGYMS